MHMLDACILEGTLCAVWWLASDYLHEDWTKRLNLQVWLATFFTKASELLGTAFLNILFCHSCKFAHPEDQKPVFTSAGLPIRPGTDSKFLKDISVSAPVTCRVSRDNYACLVLYDRHLPWAMYCRADEIFTIDNDVKCRIVGNKRSWLPLEVDHVLVGKPLCPFHEQYKWCGFAKGCKFSHREDQEVASSRRGMLGFLREPICLNTALKSSVALFDPK